VEGGDTGRGWPDPVKQTPDLARRRSDPAPTADSGASPTRHGGAARHHYCCAAAACHMPSYPQAGQRHSPNPAAARPHPCDVVLPAPALRRRGGTLEMGMGGRRGEEGWKAQRLCLSHSLPHMTPCECFERFQPTAAGELPLYYCEYLSHHTHIRMAMPLSLGWSSFCAWWYELLQTTKGAGVGVLKDVH